MALIPANALMSAPRTNEDGQELVTLYTGQDAVRAGMMEYCTNDRQKALCTKPSIDIQVYAGRVDPTKVKTRPGYLNAILIQSRGRTGRACTHCRDNPNRGPFIDCRRVPGYFDGACGNCKWRDHAARCSARRPDEESDDEVPAIEGPGGQGGQEDREVQEVQEIEYVVISSDEE